MQNFRLEIELTKHVFSLALFICVQENNIAKVRKLFYKLVFKIRCCCLKLSKKAACIAFCEGKERPQALHCCLVDR